jgi:hypothetical protein
MLRRERQVGQRSAKLLVSQDYVIAFGNISGQKLSGFQLHNTSLPVFESPVACHSCIFLKHLIDEIKYLQHLSGE